MPPRAPSPIDGISSMDPILEALLEYFDSNEIKRTFRDFYSSYGAAFSNDDKDDKEYSHRTYEAFVYYEGLFAKEMESFCKKEGVTEEAVVEALHLGLRGKGGELKDDEGECQAVDEHGDDIRGLVSNLLAALDFSSFAQRMEKEEKKNKRAMEDAEMLGL
ncbi:hypothetical protein TrCOL_g4847 [Triparma columacea]|uniref:Cilia- and flagella-associated protein 36 n=1 Tax=Triparma columacea TaxID=722753 RepID=A0A9W7LFS5_9STRA|nr:hypothetical protein TrCOL_g4847 [Triparma columacea]